MNALFSSKTSSEASGFPMGTPVRGRTVIEIRDPGSTIRDPRRKRPVPASRRGSRREPNAGRLLDHKVGVRETSGSGPRFRLPSLPPGARPVRGRAAFGLDGRHWNCRGAVLSGPSRPPFRPAVSTIEAGMGRIARRRSRSARARTASTAAAFRRLLDQDGRGQKPAHALHQLGTGAVKGSGAAGADGGLDVVVRTPRPGAAGAGPEAGHSIPSRRSRTGQGRRAHSG